MDARGGGDAGSDDASRDARDHAEILPARGAFTRYRRRPGVEGDDERYAAFLDALRARFAEDGFVFVVPDERARDDERHEDLVAAVLGEYDRTLRIAVERDDARALLRYDPQETMAHEYPGFNVRVGGRVDMDVTEATRRGRFPFARGDLDRHPTRPDGDPAPRPARSSEPFWMDYVRACLDEPSPISLRGSDPGAPREVGCVVSLEGDDDQNWHQDGDTGRDPNAPARRVIVFLAPVSVSTEADGPLEIARASHRIKCEPGQARDALPSTLAEAYVGPGVGASRLALCDRPGMVVVMDYRCWHRGLRRRAPGARPVLYRRFETRGGEIKRRRDDDDEKSTGGEPSASETTKRARRVHPQKTR